MAICRNCTTLYHLCEECKSLKEILEHQKTEIEKAIALIEYDEANPQPSINMEECLKAVDKMVQPSKDNGSICVSGNCKRSPFPGLNFVCPDCLEKDRIWRKSFGKS